MFIDFCSCYQHSEEAAGPDRDWNAYPKKGDHPGDRTKEEDDMFKEALNVMTCFYASPLTVVVQHKHVPNIQPGETGSYEKSGWCNMEQAAAQLMHEGGIKLYQLGSKDTWSFLEWRSWPCFNMSQYGVAHVEPVPTYKRDTDISPAKMREFFENEEKCAFFGKSDRKGVADMYAAFHTSLRGACQMWLCLASALETRTVPTRASSPHPPASWQGEV